MYCNIFLCSCFICFNLISPSCDDKWRPKGLNYTFSLTPSAVFHIFSLNQQQNFLLLQPTTIKVCDITWHGIILVLSCIFNQLPTTRYCDPVHCCHGNAITTWDCGHIRYWQVSTTHWSLLSFNIRFSVYLQIYVNILRCR